MSLNLADRAAIDMLYRAFNDGDAALLDRALAEDWQDIPMAPGQAAGREGLKPMLTAFLTAFEGLRFEPEEIVGEDGKAAVRLSLRGRHTGEWMGVSATGQSFTIAVHELHHIRDGRITHTWHLEDWAEWRRQIGVDPTPAG